MGGRGAGARGQGKSRVGFVKKRIPLGGKEKAKKPTSVSFSKIRSAYRALKKEMGGNKAMTLAKGVTIKALAKKLGVSTRKLASSMSIHFGSGKLVHTGGVGKGIGNIRFRVKGE